MTTQTFDDVDKALLSEVQRSFPLDHRPFQLLGQKFAVSEQECLERINRLKTRQVIRRICAVLDAQALGYRVTLAAMKVDPDRVDAAAEGLIQYPGLSHAYQLNDSFNLWMTIHVPSTDEPERIARSLQALVKADEMILLPTIRVYKRPEPHDPVDEGSWWEHQGDVEGEPSRSASRPALTAQDQQILRIIQDDLPLLEIPYAVWAEQADCAEEELFAWLRRAEHVGFLDRFAAILDARHGGLPANAMVIWQVPDDQVDEVGEAMAQFREVSYCTRRPVFPHWPYSLLSVIHASTYAACIDAAKRIETRVGRFPHKHLFTTKEYKRARVTYFSPQFETWQYE